MPLIRGKSDDAFQHNVKAEVNAGKPLKQSLAIAYAMKKKKAKGGMVDCYEDGGPVLDPSKVDKFTKGFSNAFAEGGDADFHDDEIQSGYPDFVEEMMKHYSEGGKVANDVEPEADSESSQYDDLVKDDDLEFHDTGANSGDEIGDEQEDKDRHDIVSFMMDEWKKKGRMPRPA